MLLFVKNNFSQALSSAWNLIRKTANFITNNWFQSIFEVIAFQNGTCKVCYILPATDFLCYKLLASKNKIECQIAKGILSIEKIVGQWLQLQPCQTFFHVWYHLVWEECK